MASEYVSEYRGGGGSGDTSLRGSSGVCHGREMFDSQGVEQRSWRNYRFTSSVNRRLFDDVHCSLDILCCQMKSEIHPSLGRRV